MQIFCSGSKIKFYRDNFLPPSLTARYDYYRYRHCRKTVNPDLTIYSTVGLTSSLIVFFHAIS